MAALADALVQAGILDEAAFAGDLGTFLESGLLRWANDDMGARGLCHVHLALAYTNSVEAGLGLYWRGFDHGRRDSPAGALALRACSYDTVFVEGRVRQLNALEPDAGFHVLALVSAALSDTVGVASPAWAEERVDMWDDYREEEEAEDEETLESQALACDLSVLTLQEFHRDVPEAACWAWREAEGRPVIERALRRARSGRKKDARLARLLEEAQGLLQASDELGAMIERSKPGWAFCDTCRCEEQESVFPVEIRWNDEDRIGQISDDYHHLIAQCSETDVVYLAAFDPQAWADAGRSRSVGSAAARRPTACRVWTRWTAAR